REVERAYTLSLPGDRLLFFTGNVTRLTAARKAAMYRVAYSIARSTEFPGTDAEAAAQFDRSPFGRWDNVTIVHKTITGEDGEAWGEFDYSHDHGCGSRHLANVYQYSVRA